MDSIIMKNKHQFKGIYRYFQDRFALSEQGTKDFVSGIIGSTLLNLSLMLPAIFTFIFLEDYLKKIPTTEGNHGFFFYLMIGILFIIIMYLVALYQYKSTFIKVYDESSIRRINLAEQLRKLPLAFFGEKNLSDLTTTIMDDTLQLETIFSHAVPQLFASIISILFIAMGLFFYNWQLAIALFWVLPLAAIVLLLAKRKIKKENMAFHREKRAVAEKIQEGLETIQDIKAYNGEEAYLVELDEQLKQHERVHISSELIAGGFLNLSHILLKLGLASVILVGAQLLISGNIDLFVYLVFLMVAASIYNPILEVCNHFAVLIYLDVRINRMKSIATMPTQKGISADHIKTFEIDFKKVHFAYAAEKNVLNGISFTAQQGKVTALVGPSGGGKSTTAKLAARFWDIDAGQICIGGKDISTLDPESLLQYFSIVFQDVVLFNTSVLENIRIGRKEASDEEVLHIAKMAQCDAFVQDLPQGYNTVIGENGALLSGGERQRISIARALLKDAPIILLDEATASLDVENETLIQSALSTLIKNKTVLIIAHRLRTVMQAHQIVVLEDGKIIEKGTPKDLVKQKGWLSQMAQL
jgi:ATP-binding cassette subfamily B protein